MVFRRMAPIMSSGGTSWGTNACHAVLVNPLATAPTSTRARMPIGSAAPELHSSHRPSAVSSDTACDQINTERRDTRSEMDPDQGATTVVGKKVQNAAMPTQAVEPVS